MMAGLTRAPTAGNRASGNRASGNRARPSPPRLTRRGRARSLPRHARPHRHAVLRQGWLRHLPPPADGPPCGGGGIPARDGPPFRLRPAGGAGAAARGCGGLPGAGQGPRRHHGAGGGAGGGVAPGGGNRLPDAAGAGDGGARLAAAANRRGAILPGGDHPYHRLPRRHGQHRGFADGAVATLGRADLHLRRGAGFRDAAAGGGGRLAGGTAGRHALPSPGPAGHPARRRCARPGPGRGGAGGLEAAAGRRAGGCGGAASRAAVLSCEGASPADVPRAGAGRRRGAGRGAGAPGAVRLVRG